VLNASATEGGGLPEITQKIETWIRAVQENGFLHTRRREQAVYWLRESFSEQLLQWAHRHLGGRMKDMEQQVLDGQRSPFAAADQLIQWLMDGRQDPY
jgi:putative protein kinase ArgK-like GTPase of G3E family